jgi:hypothetical protein
MEDLILNEVEILHDNVKMIKRVIDATRHCRLLNEFMPCSEEDPRLLLAWRCKNWGTMQDIMNVKSVFRMNKHTVELEFDTIFAPPLPVFDRMEELGYIVQGHMTGRNLHVLRMGGATSWKDPDCDIANDSGLSGPFPADAPSQH